MAGCGGGKMIPKYKDGGIVRVQYGSTKSADADLQSAMRKRDAILNSPTPMPDNLTPAERKALEAYNRSQKAADAEREQRYREMDENMRKGAEAYEESRRQGRQ